MCFGVFLRIVSFMSPKVKIRTPLKSETVVKLMSEMKTSQEKEPSEKTEDLPLLPNACYVKDWAIISAILAASKLPGLKLEDIIHNMNEQGAEVLAIEPVIRTDLLTIFLNVAAVAKSCADESERGWDIAFHGTLAANVIPIVQGGFQIPSRDDTGHQARFIPNWGPGIYCSPYGTYSYAYGHKWSNGIQKSSQCLDPNEKVSIFICAVLRGRTFDCNPRFLRLYRRLQPGHDSHRCPSHCEWIIFTKNRIIPLCVMWVKGDENVYSAMLGDHTRVEPGCANKTWSQRTKKLIASPAEKEYSFQCCRKGGLCSVVDPDEISKLKERIDDLGKTA